LYRSLVKVCSKFAEFPFVDEVLPLLVRFIISGFLHFFPLKVIPLMLALFRVFEFGFGFLYSQVAVIETSSDEN